MQNLNDVHGENKMLIINSQNRVKVTYVNLKKKKMNYAHFRRSC